MRNRILMALALALTLPMLGGVAAASTGTLVSDVTIDGVPVSELSPSDVLEVDCTFDVRFAPVELSSVVTVSLRLWPTTGGPTIFLVERSADLVPGEATSLVFTPDELANSLGGAGAKRSFQGYRVQLTAREGEGGNARTGGVSAALRIDGCPAYPASPLEGDLAASTSRQGDRDAGSGWPVVVVIAAACLVAIVAGRRLVTRWLTDGPTATPKDDAPNG
jgi:hypothetical protein